MHHAVAAAYDVKYDFHRTGNPRALGVSEH
jgi:hypothetical protein